MKIHQLISGVSVPVNNDEQRFIRKHGSTVRISSLDEHDQWLAQSLVRKGLYDVSKDNNHLIKNYNEKNSH